uniref:RAB11 family interacting protein 5a (class I) n=1 Tax=Tetraodon nigroviridis TaxID=99883 RepID=H3CYX5_TETNG
MSSLTVDQEQKWVPTHVQVTVLRARSLRGKGKHGTSDVYAIIQLGKEKYSTCVVEKTTAPEWREECTFELQPGVLESGSAAASNQLILTVMHQALMGLDLFLGQAVVPLGKVFSESRCLKNEWYQLKSKTGKKEKERGDIQVTVQFTRDNLTASMYDLVMKDKSMSTFGKLKERMRGKRRSSEEDSSSAVLPGGYGSLCRMRQRLPSEGGGEEDYEDDEGGEMRRSKMRTFFLRGKLRKSSDTRSSTSLGSESSESSSRGGSLSPTAGISVVVSDLSNSPSNSSNLTTDNSPEHTANLSPRSPSSLQCEFGDEAGEVSIAVPAPGRSYGRPPPDPGSGRLPACVGLAPLHRSLPVSTSLQNLSPRAFTDPATGPAGDGRRWSFDKPGEEEKAAIAAALEQSGSVLGGDELQRRLGRAEAACEGESQGKKQKKSTLSHGSSAGKGPNQGAEPEQTATAEEKHKGWFGSKDPRSKPRFVLTASSSPHPVRPLLNNTQAEEKRTEGRSVLATGLEKLKSTIHPGRSSQLSEQDSERKKFVTGGAGSYYHLNHSELVALLVQREAELEEQKEEVKDLEDYIDTLLVRIMEQKPTLLQVRSKFKKSHP